MRDIGIGFKIPHKIVGVSSITTGAQSCNIYFHLVPLGYPIIPPPAGNIVIVPTGSEPWIPLSSSQNAPGLVEGRFIVFNKPVLNFYFDIDHPAGAVTPYVTFFGADDIEAAILERT